MNISYYGLIFFFVYMVLHIVDFIIICSLQSFITLFRILSLKPAGGGGVLAYIRCSASRRSESMNVFMWFIFLSFYFNLSFSLVNSEAKFW